MDNAVAAGGHQVFVEVPGGLAGRLVQRLEHRVGGIALDLTGGCDGEADAVVHIADAGGIGLIVQFLAEVVGGEADHDQALLAILLV